MGLGSRLFVALAAASVVGAVSGGGVQLDDPDQEAGAGGEGAGSGGRSASTGGRAGSSATGGRGTYMDDVTGCWLNLGPCDRIVTSYETGAVYRKACD